MIKTPNIQNDNLKLFFKNYKTQAINDIIKSLQQK